MFETIYVRKKITLNDDNGRPVGNLPANLLIVQEFESLEDI